jgi:hypothetical protein
MLKLQGSAFTQGRSTFFDHHKDAQEPTAKVFVRVVIGDLDLPVIAQLDTGAAWSVLDPRIASLLGLLGMDGPPRVMETRFGTITGRLIKVPIRFLADEGTSFDIEGTFFISPDWQPGLTFLGYSGLLDAVRFALDPQVNHFYFGPGV